MRAVASFGAQRPAAKSRAGKIQFAYRLPTWCE
jgi:hypothetical protein